MIRQPIQSLPPDTIQTRKNSEVGWEFLYGWQADDAYYNIHVYVDRAGNEYHCCEVGPNPTPVHRNCALLFHTEVRWVRSFGRLAKHDRFTIHS